MEDVFLHLKSQLLKIIQILKGPVYRNSLIIKAITFTFFIMLLSAMIFTIAIFYVAPELSDNLSSLTKSMFDYEDVPSPFTGDFLSYIFLNNSGHYWNPIRMLVWIPFLGPLLLMFEIILNSGVIGVISVIIGIDNGIAYPIIGLVPHGIIEIPAFLLQLSSIILWQVIITETILAKLRGRHIEKDKINQSLSDTLILAVNSIVLLFIAAVIETYVTPYLLGI